MATSQNKLSQNKAAVGYACEFLDEVPEEYVCRQCKLVARHPTIADCCNETMCEACVQEMMQDKKPCSNCQKVPTKYICYIKIKNKIQELNVRCLMVSCTWTGQLQQLDNHSSNCEYVDTTCQQCKTNVQKRYMNTHLANECPEREFGCKYCNFKATYVLVTEVHFEKCKCYILDCPNGCGTHFKRGDLKDHMKMCSQKKVQCEFSYAGCETEIMRDKQKEHMEQNTQEHLALIAATMKINQEQQQANKQKLQEQKQAFEQRKNSNLTRATRSEYILLISLSVLIIACAICYERGPRDENGICNCDNIQVYEVQTLKRESEKSKASQTAESMEAMTGQTEIKIETTKIIDMQKEHENALKIEIINMQKENENKLKIEIINMQKEHENKLKIEIIDMQKEHEKEHENKITALKKKIDKINALITALKKKIDKLVTTQKSKANNEREKADPDLESFMRYIKNLWPK